MKYILFIFIYTLQLYSLDFKVASYNVENFFDLHYDKTEYKEYIPNTKHWHKTSYKNKLNNISKVIKDLDADILALQEIESTKVLKQLLHKNKKYKHHKFFKNNASAIGVALLSKYPIIKSENIKVDKYDKYARDILKVTIKIDNKPLIIYVNHWRSKRAKESKRITYAIALKTELNRLKKEDDYIILGDLNSNYNEFQTFKYDKKLNDTHNITGINQILNTTIDGNFVHKNNILQYTQNVHYNTWLDLTKNKRFSTKFKKQNNTPDNIILSASLFDTANISYINNSFNVFNKSYLFNKNKIFRWNKYTHNGYSDHLPIYAYFSTSKQNDIQQNTIKLKQLNSINHLYNVEKISNYPLKDIVVIYKSKKIAVVKQKKADKAIMIYKPSTKLKIGYSYNLTVDKIDEFFGLKEVTKISDISKQNKYPHFKNFYLDGNKVDLFNYELINNIIFNLEGMYKKNYLYYNGKKIRLYFQKGIKKPKDGEKISISSGHLSIYKSSIQIVLHKEEDFKRFN